MDCLFTISYLDYRLIIFGAASKHAVLTQQECLHYETMCLEMLPNHIFWVSCVQDLFDV